MAREVILNINWSAVGILVSLLVGWSGLLLGAIKYLLAREIGHMDDRTQHIELALETNQEKHAQNERAHADLERQILRLEGQLPNEYVRREDWIRLSGSIDAKLDAIHKRLDEVIRGRN